MKRPLNLQRGLSLVSLMVGITISMLVVVAMLATYKATLAITVDAGQGARSNGQLAAGLLAAQIELQGAGFGVESPAYATNLVVLGGAALGEGLTLEGASARPLASAGNAVVWDSASAVGGARQCGLLVFAGGNLTYARAACTQASGWAPLTWSNAVVLAEGVQGLDITARAQACRPFGLGSGRGGLVVTLAASNANGVASTHSVCVANFPG